MGPGSVGVVASIVAGGSHAGAGSGGGGICPREATRTGAAAPAPPAPVVSVTFGNKACDGPTMRAILCKVVRGLAQEAVVAEGRICGFDCLGFDCLAPIDTQESGVSIGECDILLHNKLPV